MRPACPAQRPLLRGGGIFEGDDLDVEERIVRAEHLDAVVAAAVVVPPLVALRVVDDAVAVDDRFMFNTAAYYGRDFFGVEGAPPLRRW